MAIRDGEKKAVRVGVISQVAGRLNVVGRLTL
jgi:hypothetical protein